MATNDPWPTSPRSTTSPNGAREPGLIPSYPDLGPAVHRESALVRRLVAAAGLDLSEAMSCGLGGGVGFLYAVFEYAELPHPLLTFVTQHHPRPWVEEVADNLGLELTSLTSSTSNAALKKLDAALAAGTPALLTVGRAGLPWHDDVSAMEAYDPYTVVVAGKDGDEYLVDDCGRSLEQASAEALGAAWGLHKKGRFAVTTLALPAGGPTGLSDAVRSAIATTIAHMTGPVIGNAFDVNFGLSGIGKWAAEVVDRRTKRGWRARFGEPEAFAFAMRRVVDCLTSQYGSAGATRPLYAEFLREAAAATPLELGPAADAAASCGAMWEEVVAVASEATDPERAFTSIGDLAERLVEAERRLVALLDAAITR